MNHINNTQIIEVEVPLQSDTQISPKLLYVDGPNIGYRFFFDQEKSHWCALEIVEKVKQFIKAATKSNWKLKVFMDSNTPSDETQARWQERQEALLRNETRNIPHAANVLLGDAFRENGVEVCYIVDTDKYDTIAAYAHRDGASILSDNQYFFRYEGLTSTVCGEYEIKDGLLYLTELASIHTKISKRDLISPPPQIMNRYPSMIDISNHKYRRGVSSALIKRLGNPHINCRPLRQALYARKGIQGPVIETFPVWQDGKVVWLQEKVSPDDKLVDFLDKPGEAVKLLFPDLDTQVKPNGISIKKWQNHLYAIHAIVCELCAVASENESSFLEMIRPFLINFKKSEEIPEIEKTPKPKPSYEGVCGQCKCSFQLSQGEVLFYESKGYSMPKRCKQCRESSNSERWGHKMHQKLINNNRIPVFLRR